MVVTQRNNDIIKIEFANLPCGQSSFNSQKFEFLTLSIMIKCYRSSMLPSDVDKLYQINTGSLMLNYTEL